MTQLTEFDKLFNELQEELKPNLAVIDTFSPSYFGDQEEGSSSNEHSFDYLNDDTYKSNRLELINKSNEFLLSLFEELNLKIIDGAYLENNFSTLLKIYKDKIDQLKSLFVDYFQNFIDDIVFQSFKIDLDKATNALYYLKYICSNLLYNDNQITYSLTTSLSETFDNSIIANKWELTSIEILTYNIYLIKADHYLNINNDPLIQNLEHIYSASKKLKLKSFSKDFYVKICKVIFSKSNFLKKKVLLRRSEEILSISGKLFIQSKNDFQKFSSEDIINSANLKEFEPWLRYISNHYGLHVDHASNVESAALENILSFPIKDVTLKNIHLHIKYNKDILSLDSLDSAISNLKKIKNYLVTLLSNAKEKSFDEYCLQINTTYCYNNLLSLLNEHDRSSELLELYKEFKKISSLNNRRNYFATGIVLSYYAKKLKSIFSQDNINSEILKCSQILSECKDLIELYNEDQKWFKNHTNYIYLLPTSESKVQVDDLNVYIYSSIFLPTSAGYLSSKFEKPVDEIKFYQTSFKSIESIKSSLETVENLKSSLTNLELKLSEKDTRTLELVALIGALLSFIAGSIPGFKFINTGIEALWFTIALGTSLSFFIFLLYFLNRGLEFVKKGWLVILIYFSCITLTWYLLNNSSSKYTEQKFDKNQIKNYIDSLNSNIIPLNDSLANDKSVPKNKVLYTDKK